MSSAFQQANGFKLALGLSKLFEREFNQPDLHDRVLVFDVVASKKHELSTSNVIGNKSSENDVVFQNSAGEDQREPGNQSGKVDNTSDENETGVHGCKILPMYANGQITQQHKFYVHSSWLAVQSSYFRSLFFSERNTPRRKEVHVKIPRICIEEVRIPVCKLRCSVTCNLYLLGSDELVAASENTIFHALMHWIEKRGIENLSESRELPPLLSVVRFELMTFNYLYDVVQHHPIAKMLPDFHDHYLRGISYHALSGTTRQRSLPQPATRKLNNKLPCVAYTWDIPGDQLDMLVGSDKSYRSDEFWFCGYKMVLVIEDVFQVENHALFRAKLSLEVLNLTDRSEVTIKWKPTKSDVKERKYRGLRATVIY
ncbi:uncharacterized protein LOC114541445 [Dendronephthya gigantea]|uniref:uncharacterized protein LOC114541445 n=1 Tax=Dendronephthya gigantea TaxID=151771 RepID=UPI00106B24DA|nr:uncharacterized protein LOC114541445 [Dendronephthya gigantea]